MTIQIRKILSYLLIITGIIVLVVPLVYVVLTIIDLKTAVTPSIDTGNAYNNYLEKQEDGSMLAVLYFVYLLPIIFIPISYILLFVSYCLSTAQKFSEKLKQICKFFSIFIIIESIIAIIWYTYATWDIVSEAPTLVAKLDEL